MHDTQQQQDEQDQYAGQMLTPEQLATRWQASKGHLANLRSDGEGVPYVKVGRLVRY